MILNKDELLKYRKKHKSDALLSIYSEQYEVKFRYQKQDTYWTTSTVTYYGTDKASHDAVKAKWITEYPSGDLISVTYLWATERKYSSTVPIGISR